MSDKITRPTIDLLPMSDIEEELNKVYLREDEVEKQEELLLDLLDFNSLSRIAKATEESQTTIDNSNKLGGIYAEEYVLIEDAAKINKNTHQEIIALRNELYTLKNELIKRGFADHAEPISGFHEPFRSDNKLFAQKMLSNITYGVGYEDKSIYVDAINNFTEGTYIAIHGGESPSVRRVTDTETSGDSIDVDKEIERNIHRDDAKAYEYSGEYYNGTFLFSSDAAETISNQIQYSTLDDETNKKLVSLDSLNVGLGYTFTISDSLVNENFMGYISKLKVQARAIGTPGELQCYILRYEDIGDFNHEENNIALGSSHPVYPDINGGIQNIDFEFSDIPIEARDAELNKNVFCAVIVSKNITADDYWDIMTLKGEDKPQGGLHQNNVLYEYSVSGGLRTDSDINVRDLWYRLGIREHIEGSWRLHSEGLYSANFNLRKPALGSIAQATLRVNKEGQFRTYAEGIVPAGEKIEIQPFITGYSMNPDNKIVVGEKLCDVQSRISNTVRLSQYVQIEGSPTPVYSINYDVYLLARYKVYNSGINEYEYIREDVYKLDPVYIIPAPHDTISDRIVFEKELRDEEGNLLLYNDFKIQVVWNTPASSAALENNPELAGQIYELVVAFNDDTYDPERVEYNPQWGMQIGSEYTEEGMGGIIPEGGDKRNFLAKASENDYDFKWTDSIDGGDI